MMKRQNGMILLGVLAFATIYFSTVNYVYLERRGPFFINLASSFAASLIVIILAEVLFGEDTSHKNNYN